MKAIEQKTLKFIKENNLIQDMDNILVAFSGGADSVFLLSFLKKFSDLLKIKVFAAHINHNLRGKEALSDQKFCQSFCDAREISFFTESVDVKKHSAEKKISLEAAARELRYEKLNLIAKSCDCKKIATAHNIGDNSETILFNFLKGTGVAGLKGIPIQRENIIRPVLPIFKDDIISFLKEEKISFVIDSSNLENDFKRNYIRNEIIPLIKENINPSFESALLNSSIIFSATEKIVEKHLEKFIESFVKLEPGKVEIATGFFVPENNYLFGELIKRSVKKGLNSEITFSDYKTILNLVYNQKGTKNYLSGNLIAQREKDKITICLNSDMELPESLIVCPGEKYKAGNYEISLENVVVDKPVKFSENYEQVDYDKINGKLVIRPWKNGDKFRPLGMKGFKKVADFLAEQNIESGSKPEQLVLENNGDIIWVVGLRVDDRYKITNETRNILKLRIY